MKAQVNQQFNFSFEQASFDWDCVEVRSGQFHVLYKGRSVVADVIDANSSEKRFVIRINNSNYSVQLKDQFDELLSSLGIGGPSGQQHGEIKAPMPGRVLAVVVSVGAVVTKGDGVLVLEAMKMENVIRSPADGVVKSIAVQNGTTVEKGEVLLDIE
jgi:biotin carboxyl carrier protein